jgi:hypothetical protein
MTAVDALVAVLAVATTAIGVFAMPQIWRGESTAAALAIMERIFPDDPDWGRAIVRSMPVNFVAACTLLAAYAAFRFDDRSSPATIDPAIAFGSLFALAFLTAIGLSVTIVVFNRPKSMAPHGMRDDPGLLFRRRRGNEKR